MYIIQVSRITLVVSARPADYRISGRWTYLAMSTPASWCQTFWFSKFLNWTIANVFQDSSKNLYVTLDCANTKQAKYYATVVKSGQVLISQYCSSQSKDAPAINYKYLNISWNIILSQLYDWAIIASVSVRMQTFIMRHLTIHSANNV